MVNEISGAARGVVGAISEASRETGVGFDLLVNIARRESGFDPRADAATSSAAGLFQFIEQTWLGAVKAYGGEHGLEAYAGDIARGPDGRYRVADEARRREILDLRYDAQTSAALAGELTAGNKAGLERKLGRAVSPGELYAAHFLGLAGAAKLLSAPREASAAALLPEAAAVNAPVFFNRGAARSVGDVIASFDQTMGARIEGSAGAPGDAAATSSAAARREAFAVRGRAGREPGEAPRVDAAPLALIILQALDPSELRSRERA